MYKTVSSFITRPWHRYRDYLLCWHMGHIPHSNLWLVPDSSDQWTDMLPGSVVFRSQPRFFGSLRTQLTAEHARTVLWIFLRKRCVFNPRCVAFDISQVLRNSKTESGKYFSVTLRLVNSDLEYILNSIINNRTRSSIWLHIRKIKRRKSLWKVTAF